MAESHQWAGPGASFLEFPAMRRAPIAAAAILFLGSLLAAAPAGAAEDVSSAQKKANEAAAKLSAAESQLASAEAEVAALQARTRSTRDKVRVLEGRLRSVAVQSYVQGGNVVDPSVADVVEAARGEAMLRYVVSGSTNALDEYRAAREDLDDGTAALEKQLKERKDSVGKLREQQRAIAKELAELAAAQRAAEAKAAAERAAAAKRANPKAASRAATAAPAGQPPAASGAPTGVIASGNWVCPVQGPHAFSDTWGAPRSGGRRHQGTDLMAARGTPVVANVSGSVRPNSSANGGVAYYLIGSDGNTYYGAHLDRLSGATGAVQAGTVIGYVGNSGNARGGPTHLHFAIQPGGGAAVNPYPTLRKYC